MYLVFHKSLVEDTPMPPLYVDRNITWCCKTKEDAHRLILSKAKPLDWVVAAIADLSKLSFS